MAHDRPQRVAQLVKEELGRLFTRGFKDPRIGFVTITDVELSPDLREGKVFWSVIGDEATRRETARGLAAATGYIKREIGRELNLRYTPDLRFVFDEAIERGDRIERLLKGIKDEASKREPEGGGET